MSFSAIPDTTTCAWCRRLLPMRLGLNTWPEPGDLGICYQCGELNVVTEQWTLRRATEGEMQAVEGVRLERGW